MVQLKRSAALVVLRLPKGSIISQHVAVVKDTIIPCHQGLALVLDTLHALRLLFPRSSSCDLNTTATWTVIQHSMYSRMVLVQHNTFNKYFSCTSG
jgi:hypothetical protein